MIAETAEDIRLRIECTQIERVLAELHDEVTPEVWHQLERVMKLTIALHANGLGRAIDHARASGATADFDARIAEDELLGGLLLLHGLHPLTVEQRIERELGKLRAAFGVEIEATLREGALAIAADVGETAAAMIRGALAAAAPELRSIEVRGNRFAA